MVLLFIVKNVLAYRLAASYLVFTIPYVLSNTALFTLLLLGIKSKPKDVDDGNAIFLVSLVVGNLPIVLNLFGVNLAGTHIDTAVRLGAQCFSLAAVPFYIVAVITLGKRISVLPEAKSLQTGGVYRFSRHPLYATYIYWYALQILILQSWTIAALSVIQTAMQIVRARHEESILEKNFPEYAAYSTRVWWIGPNLFGKSRPADGPSARRRPYLPLADPAERVPGLQEHT
jgi:protein-S-isoprenylcysteine O-methyltransferase Ste14